MLLRFKLAFNEDEIRCLMTTRVRKEVKFGYRISLKLIINQLKAYSRPPFSKSFLRFLKSFLTNETLNNATLDSYTTQISIIQRILQNNSGVYRKNGQPLYLLISDHFGNFVNKKILGLETEKKEALSEIVHKFSVYPNANSPESYNDIIYPLIPMVGIQELKTYCKIFIERAVLFKPKVRTVYAHTYYRGSFYYYKYEPFFKENLAVLRGFVFMVAYFKLESCTTLLYKLIERSYSKTNGLALGNGYQLVGEACIQILMHYLKNKGHNILLELYQNTKIKSIKSRIKKEADILKENTGESLI